MKKAGVTLVELLIAATIMIGVLLAIGNLFTVHQMSFFKTDSRTIATRASTAILDDLVRRTRSAIIVITGNAGDQRAGPILFPPGPYASPIFDGQGNYTTTEEHWVTLSDVPFPLQNSDYLTIDFLRNTGSLGGTLYIYNAPYQTPAPGNAAIQRVGGDTRLEDIEMWWQSGWVVFRVTVRDWAHQEVVQNSSAAYARGLR